MNLGVLVQARMGSTRLPNKILLPFDGEVTLLDFMLEKLHRIPGIKVVVATTDNQKDDVLYEYLTQKGEAVYRGSENDVLDRFISAAESNDIDAVIRICSDNPFLDEDALVELACAAKSQLNADYIGFKINQKPSILTHFGFWGEYVTLDALKKVCDLTDDKMAHEHVTYYVYNHPETFRCHWLATPDYLEGREDIRLTVDTIEDLNNAITIHQELSRSYGKYGLREIVNYLNDHSELTHSMCAMINNNIKK